MSSDSNWQRLKAAPQPLSSGLDSFVSKSKKPRARALSHIGFGFLTNLGNLSEVGIKPKSPSEVTFLDTYDTEGCNQCAFTFLQNNLNLKNSNKVEDIYSVEREALGKGSFGQVFLAIHKVTGEKRAIKLIFKKKFTLTEEQKLQQEMEILQDLTHPCILRICEFFETKSRVMVVTDVYEGGELFEEIIARKEFQEKDAKIVLQQLLSCVAYYNSKLIVHRDIKPENVMLERKGDISSIKLIDFGNATFFNPKKDELMKTRYGTPYYMAPEVLQHSYNHKCDIWSIGVIAYVLFCGRPPFNGYNNEMIFQKILAGNYSFEADIWKNVSNHAKDFIKLLLTYDFTLRTEAIDALKHKFFSKNTKNLFATLIHTKGKKNDKFGGEAAMNLRNFKCRQKLVQVVYNYLINHFLSSEHREELAVVFKEWDKDHDGVLSKEEVKQGLKKYNRKLFRAVNVDQLFDSLDNNGNGSIDYQEFLIAATDEKALMSTDNLNAVFDMIDADGDGRINVKELSELINTKDGISSAEVLDMIEEADEDGDGQISRSEFIALLLPESDSCYEDLTHVEDEN